MAKRSMGNMLGSWSFLIGVILALIVGAVGNLGQTTTYVLVILGVVIGLLNIADKEVAPFLMAGAVLVIVSALGSNILSSVDWIKGILDAIMVIFVPATVVVAIKSVFNLAKN